MWPTSIPDSKTPPWSEDANTLQSLPSPHLMMMMMMLEVRG